MNLRTFELKTPNLVGIIVGAFIFISSTFFFNTNYFYFIIGSAIIVIISPFVFSTLHQSSIIHEKERMFLEFTGDLVESVETGIPISKSIINLGKKPYGALSENVSKLANQVSIGIPVTKALKIFSDDINDKTISRAVTLIGQAEKAGGNIEEILQSVAEAVNLSDKLKKERKSAISSLIAQGYIIFFIFMIILLVMQFKILPILSGVSGSGFGGSLSGTSISGINSGGPPVSPEEFSSAFLILLLIQGFFMGLIIGQLSEGKLKSGIKHSFILMLISFLFSSVANLVL